MRVLVLNPPYLRRRYNRVCRFDHIAISKTLWFPIHLAYCAGLLEKHGHDVELVDAIADELSLEETVKVAKSFYPDIVVMNYSIFTSSQDELTAETIKNSTEASLFVVGHSCQCIDIDQFLTTNPSVDGVIRGEYDFPVLDLANGVPWGDVKNLSWRKRDKVFHNPMRLPVTSEQLDEFPFVSDVYRRHLDIRKYRQAPQLHPFVDMFTGRGCAYNKCVFCIWAYTYNKGSFYRTRSIENVIAEFHFIKEKLPFVKEVFIQDDTLTAWRAKELATAIIKEGLDAAWSCYTRPVKSMTYETLKLMKKSGCRCLHVGYESADQKILNAVKKGTTPEEMERFTEDAYRAGLQIHADFIVGLPYETVNTIKATIKWAKRLKVHSYQFITPKLYERTPLYNLVLASGGSVKDGEVSYPYLTNEEIHTWAGIATKECLLNPAFLKRLLLLPSEWGRVTISAINVFPHLLPYLLKGVG